MWEILGGLLVGTAASGILPLVNAELLVVGVVVAAPEIGVPLVAAVSATGQMLTKTMLFGFARWAPGRLKGSARAVLERASQAVAARGGAASSLIFTSAATGLPPFYGVSLAAGALGMRLRSFVVSGTAGRLIRFAAIAWAARLAGQGATELFASLAQIGASVVG
jgi:membrane protein YqaA with SNARE-associated domain